MSDRIYTFDAHSADTTNWVWHNYMPVDLDLRAKLPNDLLVIAPDKGAIERAAEFNTIYGRLAPIVRCEKKRDFATGKFTGFTMPPLTQAGNYIIVDDICDGGGTFNLLAEEFFKDPYAKDSTLSLWVSHGIFSKGLDAIDSRIKHIYTTDSWCVAERPRLTIFSLQPIIDQIKKDYEDEYR